MKISVKEACLGLKRDLIANVLIVLMITLLLSVSVVIISYYFELPDSDFNTNSHFLYQRPSDNDDRYKQFDATASMWLNENNNSYTENTIDALNTLEDITFFTCKEGAVSLPKDDFTSKIPEDERNQFACNMSFSTYNGEAQENYIKDSGGRDYLDVVKEIYDMPREIDYYDAPELGQVATVSAFQLDQNAIEHFDVKVQDGRLFEPQEYILSSFDDEIPLLMGYNYIGKYDLNETLEISLSSFVFNARVVGFLEKGKTVDFLGAFASETASSTLDNSIISPSFDIDFKAPATNLEFFTGLWNMGKLYHGSGVIIPSDTTPKELLSYQIQIKDICLNNGVPPLLLAEPTLGFLYFIKETDSTVKLLMQISIAMVLLDLLILYLFFISKLSRNMRRYAILVMNGWSIKSIILACVLEAMFLVFLPVCIVSIIHHQQIAGNLMYILLIFCVVAVLIAIISGFICLKLRKLNIESLIRGAE